ncbi:putative O-methyltransferase [Dothidotthia symphoricarpi CBS 119687]|uniref:Putative O-methyltransferase n=1 Tax=Dothidotthia symphoricarpi CBS 119687 TaxID=1392245 RepID=A0A6A6A924_9PLEO|nr:putative O-methyltransferase [Dothidotthia symphoricarpi CBS 119687]KAF2128310.1 putative O-methyltransferase [Dothidotthia symphoricarpi CBS 119687]
MPSHPFGGNNATTVLEGLQQTLRESIDALTSPKVAAELQETLHNDKRLPDQDIAGLASEVIDLVSKIEQLLQPAHLVLADHFLGYTDTKCLVAANELRLADILADGPLTVQELAQASSARPDRLGQILVPLRNNGVFSYDESAGTYANTHVSTLLHSKHWTQWHNWVELYGNQFYDIARGIPQSVRSDATRWAAQINYDTDMNMFEYFNAQGWMPQLHRTLGGGATAMAPGIVEDYPWNDISDKTVLDVGGGGGSFIATLLRNFPTMQGSIYDLPHVIAHTSDLFSQGGTFEDLTDRVPQAHLIGGDFMKWVPPSEVYTMKWCLHDWTDEPATTILRNIRKAIVPGPVSRLVVLESILSDGRMGRLSRYGDINMMMTANGQERTLAQWEKLVKEAGWKIEKIHPLRNAWVQAIDLRPA